MFWIYEVLAGKESKDLKEKSLPSQFDLEWSKLEQWYFDQHLLR